MSTTRAVTPAITIGQGWRNNATDAMKGMNPTDVFTFATGSLNESESLTIPMIAKVASAFQNLDGNGAGNSHARPKRSEEHTSELQSRLHLVCRLLLEKKKET